MTGPRARGPWIGWRIARIRSLIVFTALLGAVSMRGACASPLPSGTRVEWVIEDGVVSGQRVSVQRILTPAAPEVLREALMPEAGDATSTVHRVRSQSGRWQVLSVRTDAGYRTLQWRALPDGLVEALFTRWSSPQRGQRAGFDPGALLPTGTHLLRRFAGRDDDRFNETLVAWSREPVARFAAQLHARLLASGLQSEPTRDTSGAGIARFYRGRGREVALTVTPHAGRSALVLHHSEVSP